MRTVVALILLVLAAAGCAVHRKPVADLVAAKPPAETLEIFIEKVRKLAAEARPQRQQARTIEQAEPGLAAALAALAVMPSADAERRVGEEYRRVGILDAAAEHFHAALRLNPADAMAYDGLARIWRDWGLAHLGLGDAWRACYYAPESPVVHNTRGTLLLAVARRADARAAFQRALQLDASAAYVLNNLCYTWFLEGQPSKAIDACQQAQALAPALSPVRNNLALAYAAAGYVGAARRTFEGDGAAAAQYNLGIVHMAAGRYRDAAAAFGAAAAAMPQLPHATARLAQARRLAAPEEP